MTEKEKEYPLEEAIRAQKALRDLAGLKPEMFPIASFIGMVSDEIDVLRNGGHSDQQIAEVICTHSRIEVTADELAEHYAPADQRHPQ